MSKQQGKTPASDAITDSDVMLFREEKRKRATGKIGQPAAHSQAADPVAQANSILAHAKAQGVTGRALEDLKRSLLASLTRVAGIQVVQFPHDVDGIPPGFRVMDIRVILPVAPTTGVQSGKQTFVNANAKGVYEADGKVYTLITSLSEYSPKQGTAEEQRRRAEAAKENALFRIPAAAGTPQLRRRAADEDQDEDQDEE